MKKSFKWFKMNLIIGAYVLASFFAVAFKPANVDTGLHWFEYDESTETIGEYIGTSSAELSAAGCPSVDDPTICALGFDEENVDLSDPENPDLTPEAKADPMDTSEEERYRTTP